MIVTSVNRRLIHFISIEEIVIFKAYMTWFISYDASCDRIDQHKKSPVGVIKHSHWKCSLSSFLQYQQTYRGLTIYNPCGRRPPPKKGYIRFMGLGIKAYQIYLGFMAHEANNLDSFIGWVRCINKCSASVDVISTQCVNHGLDRL